MCELGLNHTLQARGLGMSKKHYQRKAALARASQWKISSSTPLPDLERQHEPCVEGMSLLPVEQTFLDPQFKRMDESLGLCPLTTCTTSLSDSDCEYAGGVNHDPDSDCLIESNSGDSDTESLYELEGKELEENLKNLWKAGENAEWSNVTGWNSFLETKTREDWKKAKKNRTLGYNGHSVRTHQQREEARDRAAV